MRIIFAIILLVFIGANPVFAYRVPALDIPQLTSNSDLIVVGKITKSSWKAISNSEGEENGEIAVDRIIKGDPLTIKSNRIKITLVDSNLQEDAVGRSATYFGWGQYGIFFLKALSSNSYGESRFTPTHRYYPLLVTLPGCHSILPGNQVVPLKSVAEELVCALNVGQSTDFDTIPKLAYPPNVNDDQSLIIAKQEGVLILASDALYSVPGEMVRDSLDKYVHGDYPFLNRIWALQILLIHGYADGIDELVPELLKADKEKFKTTIGRFAAALNNLRSNDPHVSGLALPPLSGLKDASQAPMLAQVLPMLVNSDNIDLRQSAILAMEQLNLIEMIAPLVAMIRHPDDFVHHHAISGLIQLKNNPVYQSVLATAPVYSKDDAQVMSYNNYLIQYQDAWIAWIKAHPTMIK